MEVTATEGPAKTQKAAAQPTIGGSVYVKPQDIAWEPTQFDGISIKILYEAVVQANSSGDGSGRSTRPTPTKAPLSSPSIASRIFSSIARDILAGAAEGGPSLPAGRTG